MTRPLPAKALFVRAAPFALLSAAAIAEPLPESATFIGMCDASAASAIDAERFIVADDEDNILRVYSRRGGEPLLGVDLSAFLGNTGKKKPKEADLEAAAQVGSKTYWITSHGRNSKGKDQPERERFFATEVKTSGDKIAIEPVGKPYLSLLDDLVANEKLKPYDLESASKLAPKSPGALNIEGMTATPDGHLYIAFRNPVPAGKALIVPLLNPEALITGGKAQFSNPIELDLGGLGIRGIDFHQGKYIIIAGATGDAGGSRIFVWDGKAQPRAAEGVSLQGLNPEGIAFHDKQGGGEYFLLSDDGTRPIDGRDCKDLKDPSLKQFRGRVVDL
jgi:hypothetical protein